MLKQDGIGALVAGLVVGIGLASIIDLAGRLTYQAMQQTMPSPPTWDPSSAFQSASMTLGSARSIAKDQRINA